MRHRREPLAGAHGIGRRGLLGTAGALLVAPLAAPSAVRAQTPGRVFRIAYVSGGAPGPQPPAFVPALRDLGYVEGQNLVIEWRHAEGQGERLPAPVDEVLRTRPELIAAAST